LPIGVQLTGPPLEERSLLEIAKQIENIVNFNARPQLIG
jgi:Asp-tRNA(Asn)/Glu-tRNA(Gln) amidotransferase A subunit family amidase